MVLVRIYHLITLLPLFRKYSMAEIDPVQFGEMLAEMRALTKQVQDLKLEVEGLNAEVQSFVDLRNSGKGILIGLMITGGTVGATVSHFWEKIFK